VQFGRQALTFRKITLLPFSGSSTERHFQLRLKYLVSLHPLTPQSMVVTVRTTSRKHCETGKKEGLYSCIIYTNVWYQLPYYKPLLSEKPVRNVWGTSMKASLPPSPRTPREISCLLRLSWLPHSSILPLLLTPLYLPVPMGLISPPPGFDPRTIQSVANRYTDWATGPILYMLRHKDLTDLITQTGYSQW